LLLLLLLFAFFLASANAANAFFVARLMCTIELASQAQKLLLPLCCWPTAEGTAPTNYRAVLKLLAGLR
jgi:hypothetical protein